MILDTNAVSALFQGDRELEALLADQERHHLPVIVVGEYCYGILRSSYRIHLQNLLEVLVQESEILEVDSSTARLYAEARLGLRESGHPIPENDIWIGALALQYLLPIVSRDRHFDFIPGIQRLQW